MMAMLVVATALTLIGGFVHTTAPNEDQFEVEYIAKLFQEDDMTPEFTEQLRSHDHTSDITTRRGIVKGDKYRPLENEAKARPQRTSDKLMHHVLTPNVSTVIPPKSLVHKAIASDDNMKLPRNINHEEIDVVDREDHVTQYLSDQMVNTDSEITGLQASESEDESGRSSVSNEITADKFFAFLAGLEEAVEVDGVWSRPNAVDFSMKNLVNGYQNDNAT